MNAENKPKRKVLKYILLVLFIIVVIFIVLTVRKMIIISNLQNKIRTYTESTNYYAKVLSNEGESTTVTECYVKNSQYILYLTNTNKNDTRKIINYFDGTKINTYIESNGEKIALLDSNGLPGLILITDYVSIEDNLYLLLASIFSSIKSEKINEKDCYYINRAISPNLLIVEGKQGAYIDKETGLLVKAYNGTSTNSDGEKFDIIVEYEYKFNVVTDENLKEPDISEYKVQDNT